jgi:hypothetical protein
LCGAKFEAREPKALFDTGSDMTLSFNNSFDVCKDGRFLIPARPAESGPSPFDSYGQLDSGSPEMGVFGPVRIICPKVTSDEVGDPPK